MKRAMVCALAVGLAGTAVVARAEGGDCCKAAGAACCAGEEGKVCLNADGISVAEIAKRLSDAFGTEVRVQGPAFEKLTLKLCAPAVPARRAKSV